MDTYSIKLSGVEVGRVSGDGIKPGQKLAGPAYAVPPQIMDDLRMLSLKKDGRTVFVLYVSGRDDVSVEKVDILAEAAAELARPINEKIAEEMERSASNGLPSLRYPGKL